MTAAVTRTFPSPRTYQNWLRELLPLHPRRLWFSHLLVHRIEALVGVARACTLEAFSLALLRRLFISPAACATLASLERFHFDRQLASTILRELAVAGLVYGNDEDWTLSDAGRQALATGRYRQPAQERRVFFFLDNLGAAPPQFVPLSQTAGTLAEVDAAWAFDPAQLCNCVAHPAEWKQRFGFAEDIESVVLPSGNSWRQVILDRAEHAPLLFVETGAALVGCLVRCDNWTLQREPAALTLRDGWQDLFPEFAESSSSLAWREAWLTWCQTRQLPAEEMATCQVEHVDCKVRVKVPKAVLERLRAARHEVLRGETWLTLGTGRTRAAALVEIREQD